MKKIVAFEAEDGTTFKTKAEALAYDAKLTSDRIIAGFASEVAPALAREMSADEAGEILSQALRTHGATLVAAFAPVPKRPRQSKTELPAPGQDAPSAQRPEANTGEQVS